jgi:hypothetical protein
VEKPVERGVVAFVTCDEVKAPQKSKEATLRLRNFLQAKLGDHSSPIDEIFTTSKGFGVRCSDEKTLRAFLALLKSKLGEADKNIVVPTNERLVALFGLDQEMSEDEIRASILKKNACFQYVDPSKVGRVKKTKSGKVTFLALHAEAFAKLPETKRLYCGYQMARVEVAKPKLLQCYSCGKFGHTTKLCRNKGTAGCLGCDSLEHLLISCPGEGKHCRNCRDYSGRVSNGSLQPHKTVDLAVCPAAKAFIAKRS